MGAPVSHGIVLAFFDFLKRHRPDVTTLTGVDEWQYKELIEDFLSLFVHMGLQRYNNDLEVLASDDIRLALTRERDACSLNDATLRQVDRLQRWSGDFWDYTVEIANDLHKNSDHYARYKQIDNHIIFFAPRTDYNIQKYVHNFLGELHEMSADFADIYFIVGESGRWEQGYNLRRSLQTVPGMEEVRNVDFPCMFLWSDRAHVLLHLIHLQSSQELLTTYLRQVFDILEIRNRPLDKKMVSEVLDLPLSAGSNSPNVSTETLALRARPSGLLIPTSEKIGGP